MRVLIIAQADVGGSLAHLAHDLRANGAADARLVVAQADPVGEFDEDICDPIDGGAEARSLLAEAQALHVVDLDPAAVSVFGAPLSARGDLPGVLQIDRAPRGHWSALADAARARGWALVTTDAAAALATGAELMTPFVPLWRGPWQPLAEGTRTRESVRRPGVVFASSRIPFRRRPALERLVDLADDTVGPGWTVETQIGRPQRSVLRKRRFAHVCLASGERGLGLSAFEALAQGLAVVSDAKPELLESYARVVGTPPPVLGPDALEGLLDGIRPREAADPRYRAWAERALAPARWLEACARLYGADRSAA